jgi:DNA-binding SARP family transcriptional activator
MNDPFSAARRRKIVPLEFGENAEIGHSPAVSRPIARIHLLGRMRAMTYLGDSILPRGKKARALLGYLCLASGARVPRASLATMLWDRVGDALARASLRQALRELSAAMGAFADELILVDRDTVGLRADVCWIDAVALLAKEPPASNSPRGDLSPRSDLAVLCAGNLLEELDDASPGFDQWLLGERTRFSAQLRGLLEAEIRQIDQPGCDAKQLAAVARRLIAFDPTHEGASRVLMRALMKMGERAQALWEYARCRDALRNLLDAEPSSETQALHETVRAYSGSDGEADAPSDPDRAPCAASHSLRPLAGRSRLRVGVLPFRGDRSLNEESLAFSLSQEIATALARFRWFDVIAPVSLMCKPSPGYVTAFQLTPKELDYVVDGSIAGSGEHYEIGVRLLDLAQHAQPVWSNSFKLAVGELHHLEEIVTARIVGQIDPVTLFIERRPKRQERYGTTGLIFLAIPLIYSMERKKYEEAGALINQALEIDPDNGKVLAWAAFWQLWYAGQGWTQDFAGALTNAERLCLRAIRSDPDNAEALGIYAHACAWKREFDSALYFFDQALRLNPNLAYIWALSALTYCYIGDPDTALSRLERYRNLAPLDPYFCFFENAYTIAYTFKGEYEQAVLIGRRALKINPNFVAGYKPLIAAFGHLGRRDEAEPYIEKLLSIEPDFSVEGFGKTYPFKREIDRARYMEGLRLAGVHGR